jgi:hypothetical protein
MSADRYRNSRIVLRSDLPVLLQTLRYIVDNAEARGEGEDLVISLSDAFIEKAKRTLARFETHNE